MTLDRDVRLSADDVTRLQDAARRRLRQLTRSICTAEANRAAGATVQDGTLDRHYRERSELAAAAEKLEAARKAIGRQLAAVIEEDRR